MTTVSSTQTMVESWVLPSFSSSHCTTEIVKCLNSLVLGANKTRWAQNYKNSYKLSDCLV